MKSYGQLWEKVVSEENLWAAWGRVKKGRASSKRISSYGLRIERNLKVLREKLVSESYEPGHYRQFAVMDPKPRTISCAPVADRVVHHAVCGVIAPLLERRFVSRTYACRAGYGMHQACFMAQWELKKHRYFIKLDVRHYFQSIDHDILVRILSGMFRERPMRELLEKIVRHPVPGNEPGKGVPIGNLTSQWFANLYLDGLDHYVMDGLGAGRRYFRYMDDILIFCETKDEAERYHAKISKWVEENRKLTLKETATRIAPVTDGVPFLGLRIWEGAWRLKRSRFVHARRAAAGKVRQWRQGGIGAKQLTASLASILGSYGWFGFRNVLGKVSATGEKAPGPVVGCGCENDVTLRGGNWNNDATNSRSACRNGDNAVSRTNNNIGFRLSSTLRGTSGRKCTSPVVAALGTTMPRIRAARVAMATKACRTRTTTTASASPAPGKGVSHPVRPALRAMRAGPNMERRLRRVA